LNTVSFKAIVNGERVAVEIPLQLRLIDLLRDVLGLTGTKEGCGEGECGACTVIVDGEIVNSCLMFAQQAQGKEILTIEGLSRGNALHPIQEAFIEQGAVQCGFCTPGMVLATKALLDKNLAPTRQEIAVALSGNVCRCTGYEKIIEAVTAASKKLSSEAAGNNRAQRDTLSDNKVGVVGQSVIRCDARLKVLGQSIYAADIVLPGMLYAKVLRSPCAHARIKMIDAGVARSLPGVVVFTHKDIPGTNAFGIIVKDEPALVSEKIRCRGDALVLVAAESEAAGADALKAISVEVEELPAVFDPEQAMQTGAPIVHGSSNIMDQARIRRGDADRALQGCDVVVTRRYHTQMVEHSYIEPEAGIAYLDGDMVVIKASTQNPHYDRKDVAANLALPLNRVRVIQAVTGGGFGGKLDISVQIYLALIALRTGRPVRMVFDREESFQASSKRHPFCIDYTTGATSDGMLQAVKVRLVCDTGAYASYGPATMKRALVHVAGPYCVPNVSVDGYCVYTNNPRSGAMRGFGVPQVAFAHESQMDEIAARLGVSPLEIRMKNALRTGSVTVTGQALGESVGLVETLTRVGEQAGLTLPGSGGCPS
jgi:xanthine dehydrogenase molybdopterin-binding subunit B/aerobic-type carbon monoxide dehydrogenase small subunit (CoxS/CutS family)